jgi:hypothetical protein
VAIRSNLNQVEWHERVPLRSRWEKLGKRSRIGPRAVSPNTQEVGFSVEISPLAAGEFFRALAVPDLEAVPEARKKSP